MSQNVLIGLNLVYTGFYQVNRWWNFKNLVSPLYRLYFITKGECQITFEKQVFKLQAGDMFLVPKFVSASYQCDNYMEHYYICLIDGQHGGTGVVNPSCMLHQRKTTPADEALITRLQTICPDYKLPSTDPKIYDNKKELLTHHPRISPDPSVYLEAHGIIEQLFSRFITPESMTLTSKLGHSYLQLAPTIEYINENLASRITVLSLAERICLSPDHFSKLFKSIMGASPIEYIQEKKLERAQELLLGTSLNMQEIAERVGFETGSQLSRLFSQKLSCTPKEYRANHFKS